MEPYCCHAPEGSGNVHWSLPHSFESSASRRIGRYLSSSGTVGVASGTWAAPGSALQDPILGAYTLEGLRLAVDPVNRRLIEVAGLLL